ncbi:hypothetical protein [Streptomyces bugieae]|uniref:ANTAR domain-containing protein n=1 Tax=Streptomyces bugieae TaxID=3098223 RepID=A0ABU7NIG7_9ACTN|nr:hypothetical protein [Streptomyces sp. DSM 41528]
MSRTELERLARIRMQVTGETLERAMAVLQGQAAAPDPEADHAPESDRTLPDVEPEATEPGFEPTLVPALDDEPALSGDGDAEPADPSDEGEPPPQRRPHLRGL